MFEEVGPPPSPFHGGFGLVNLQGLHKPSYYAYKFLHEMGDKELECNDSSATLCRSSNGAEALIWNYTCPTQDAPNNIYFKRDLPAKPIAPGTFETVNIEAGKPFQRTLEMREKEVYLVTLSKPERLQGS